MYDKCYFCLDQLPKLKKESTASFFVNFGGAGVQKSRPTLLYIKQYKSQRQKWKDTKIQEDKMKELQSLQPAVFPLPQHGTMQGFIRLQFLRTKCFEKAQP